MRFGGIPVIVTPKMKPTEIVPAERYDYSYDFDCMDWVLTIYYMSSDGELKTTKASKKAGKECDDRFQFIIPRDIYETFDDPNLI